MMSAVPMNCKEPLLEHYWVVLIDGMDIQLKELGEKLAISQLLT